MALIVDGGFLACKPDVREKADRDTGGQRVYDDGIAPRTGGAD